MRCGHAADASLAPTETPPTLCCGTNPSAECPGASKISGATAAKSVQLAGQPKGESMRPLVSSVLVLIPGLLRRVLCGAEAGRCPRSA
jgi:hypothetical protein